MTPVPQRDPLLRNAIIVIAVIAGFSALKLGEDIFAPMVLALVGGVILAPITGFLERAGLPRGLVAGGVVAACVVMIAALAFLIEPLIWRLVDLMPRIQFELRDIVEQLRDVIHGLDEMNKEVEEALGAETAGEGEVAQNVPKLTDALFFAPVLVAQTAVFLGTLFFFLLTRHGIYDWLSGRVGETQSDSNEMRGRFRNAESLVSRYFLTVCVVNFTLGAALAGVLIVIGLPAPLVWGVAAAALNFVLYLGPMLIAAGLFIAGIVAFDGLMSVVPALAFLCLNVTEGQFVTPAIVGRHVAVNPLLVFTSLVVWLWLWGPIGGVIAIPVLVITLALLDIFGNTPETENVP